MGKSLYRSYRSTSFDEIIGQDHITTTLKNSLKNDAVSHAYLLSGPKGVGKTSIARILAYAVNNLPYDPETTNLDIIEIDAASNRRIDEIREIRERVHIAPTGGRYKVYIIDEVHMLTREAFNALLKTLEEPPPHAIFILATTEAHKVPETIISRCIRFTFKPIAAEIIAKHLATISAKEKINISPEALMLIAEHSKGSFRDGISLLEQVKHFSETIGIGEVNIMLGLAPEKILEEIINAVSSGNIQNLQTCLNNAYEMGADESRLASQLGTRFRHMLINNEATSLSISSILGVQGDLLNVSGSPKPRTALELCLYNVALKRGDTISVTEASVSQSSIETKELSIPKTLHTKNKTGKKPNDPQEIKPAENLPTPKNSQRSELWPQLLAILKKKNTTLYGIARMAHVSESNDSVHLRFNFAFHHKQVTDSKNHALFSELLNKLNGRPVTLKIDLTNGEKLVANSTSKAHLQNVSNIFGSHEVLES